MNKLVKTIQFWLRIKRLQLLQFIAESDEKLSQTKLYRKLLGGSWYFITNIETGEDYWTDCEPSSYHAMIHKVEHHE